MEPNTNKPVPVQGARTGTLTTRIGKVRQADANGFGHLGSYSLTNSI